jgi:hypothetical protein
MRSLNLRSLKGGVTRAVAQIKKLGGGGHGNSRCHQGVQSCKALHYAKPEGDEGGALAEPVALAFRTPSARFDGRPGGRGPDL